MKFINKLLSPDTIRIRKYFAWFPVEICYDDTKETCWLETVTVKEIHSGLENAETWKVIEFID